MSYFGLPTPRIFGHRGAAGVAPENTLPSFALAREFGAPYLELDVHGTKDGVVVALHDPTLDRTTNGSGAVRDTCWVDIAPLDAGYRFTTDGKTFPYRGQGVAVPTLEEVLRAHPDGRFNIEIKQESPPIVDDVIEILERTASLDRVLLAAEHHSIMERIRARGGTATSMSAEEAVEFFRRLYANDWDGYRTSAKAAQIPFYLEGVALVTNASVEALHRYGCEVHVWTINERREISQLLDLGVDGIMSDFPGRVRQVVRERGST